MLEFHIKREGAGGGGGPEVDGTTVNIRSVIFPHLMMIHVVCFK